MMKTAKSYHGKLIMDMMLNIMILFKRMIATEIENNDNNHNTYGEKIILIKQQ